MQTSIVNVMKEAYDRGWITTRDGNISVKRKDQEWFYITPSGYRKNVLRVEDLIKIRYKDGKLDIPNNANPSAELSMHDKLQRQASGNRAVVHLHPTHTVALIYAGYDILDIAKEFPELSRYTRVGKTVPVIQFGSDELADATYDSLIKDGKKVNDIVVQSNHGVTAIAGDPWSAFEHIERLEHISKIVLAAK